MKLSLQKLWLVGELLVFCAADGSVDKAELERKWGTDWTFSGISTFAHLQHVKCLTNPEELFDVAIIGLPFDTAVSYRPGARFGPRAIRVGSSRHSAARGFNARAGINPYTSWAKILDCGDVPITPFDNAVALEQMTQAFVQLGAKASFSAVYPSPKLIALGGDHSICLPALRALNKIYGRPITIVHFDAHLDTWHPSKYPSAWESEQSSFNHGSMYWMAGQEGLIANGSVHAGLRTRLSGDGWDDYEDDSRQGFLRISTDDIDEIGIKGIVSAITSRVGLDEPVYLSIDIDVIDPGLAPGTGTPEPGGWSTRELIQILRGIESLNIVGADVVEVAPPFDGQSEQTAFAAAQVVFEILSSIVKRGLNDSKSQKGTGALAKDEL